MTSDNLTLSHQTPSNLSYLSNAEQIPGLTTLHTEQEVQRALKQLQQSLSEFDDERGTLSNILDSSAKHLPAYLKIVKGHLEQLARVLQLDSHQQRTLDYRELATPLQQAVQLFQHLTESDVTLLETLARQAETWHQATQPHTASHASHATEKVL